MYDARDIDYITCSHYRMSSSMDLVRLAITSLLRQGQWYDSPEYLSHRIGRDLLFACLFRLKETSQTMSLLAAYLLGSLSISTLPARQSELERLQIGFEVINIERG